MEQKASIVGSKVAAGQTKDVKLYRNQMTKSGV
jgi:hypothetical protein